VADYFETAQPWERPIFDVVAAHLEGQGEVIVDPIAMGIQFKNGPVFCMLRAMKRWTALGFSLRRRLEPDEATGNGMVPDDVEDLF
jgi:hypothetical protein